MKVSILPENIVNIIPLITKVLPTRPQVPILSNVLLQATSAGLYLKATDMELGIEIKIPAKVEEEGSITIPGKEFVEAINSLPKDKLTIELLKDIVVVSCRESKVQFNTISSNEFPQLYKEKGEKVLSFSRKEFVDIFSYLTFSVSTEESRPQLSGVFLDKKDSYVNFVSTDGYRMSIKKVVNGASSLKENVIIAVGIVNEILALKGEDEIVLSVNKAENQIVFEVGDVVVVGRMLEGAFPDYERVVPVDCSTTVVFTREELLQSVKLASVFARESTNVINVEIKGDSMRLTTKTQGVGEGEAIVECKKTGEDVSISFNIKYLLDVLKSVNDNEIELRLNSAMSPALFVCPKKDFMHVIMPIQVDQS